jgi:hypothetical protein
MSSEPGTPKHAVCAEERCFVDPPPARAEEPTLPRVIGVPYVAAGLLGLVSLALAHPPNVNHHGLAGLGVVAVLVGSLFLSFAKVIPRWLVEVSIGGGSAMIALAAKNELPPPRMAVGLLRACAVQSERPDRLLARDAPSVPRMRTAISSS